MLPYELFYKHKVVKILIAPKKFHWCASLRENNINIILILQLKIFFKLYFVTFSLKKYNEDLSFSH